MKVNDRLNDLASREGAVLLNETVFEVAEKGSGGYRSDHPLRSEILSREELIQLAIRLGTEDTVSFFPRRRGVANIYSRFQENVRILEQAYFALVNAAKTGETLSPGGEWLLDNYHVVEQHVREIRKLLPKNYYRSLPILTSRSLTALEVSREISYGIPRVYALAFALISHTDAVVDAELLTAFITAYQSKQVLSIGELWAIPIMLRLALLENLRRLSSITLAASDASKRISALVENVLGGDGQIGTQILLNLVTALKNEGELSPSASAFLIRQLRIYGPKSALALNWFEQWLSERGVQVEDLIREEWFSKAANQISIGNTFTSLKTILMLDWLEWFETNSAVDAILRQDPAATYQRSDFTTRNRYRSKIEILSRKVLQPEIEIANKLISFAEQQGKEFISQAEDQALSQKLLHIGYYLVGKGAPLFEVRLGIRSKTQNFKHWIAESASFPLYLGAISTLTIFFILLNLSGELLSQMDVWVYGLTALLLLFPASDLAINVVHWFITHLMQPSWLARLDLKTGVPDRYRTVVTVHSILRDAKTIGEAIDFLEVRFLANNDTNIYFAFLSDLPDADQETCPEDITLINLAKDRVQKLNQRYFSGKPERFFLLTRKRVWSSSEKRFLSWERKRGKVIEFNRMILGFQDTTFTVQVGDARALTEIKYVITLDADTSLPHGAAKRLIATIAHPLNAPQFNPKTNMVVEGYGVIQPRLEVSLESGQATAFSKIFVGLSGVDPYTLAVSDVYQDVFHEGSYIGKGIYDVQTFERALEGRVPESTLLSHDLFEGLFARVALATDIELYDQFPKAYNAYAKRQHRWVRGDWQLLPWMFNSIPTADGKKVASPISAFGRWKLMDNLRRSLIAPSSLALMIFAWSCLPGSPLWWTLLIFIVIAFPVYAHLATTVITSPFGMSFTGYARDIGREIRKNSFQALLTFSFLPYQAFLMSHAIGVTLYRLYISKRNLLDWETSYNTDQRLGTNVFAFIKQMLPALVIVACITILLAIVAPSQLLGAASVLVFWLCSPLLAYWVSQPVSSSIPPLSQSDRQKLKQIALQTWEFFDDEVGEDTNYLVPDNVQLFPRRIIAYRTSPTNIGLYYLSIVAALDFGFITPVSAVKKLYQSFQTLDKLERINGHFFNWYDIQSLKPLEPRYVSTVDSGNLVGHLIVVKNALEELSKLPELESSLTELNFILERSSTLIEQTDFKFLYNNQRKVFSIGYHASDGKFDNSFYDLLGSEARLTSLIAIAKGEVPQEHWFILGRPLTQSLGGKALLSWSGTMFEYLMPLLVTKDFPHTILHETYKAVVETQRLYAIKRGVPAGISESAYAGVDFEHTYQYRAFGVPGLGLKRGLSDDLVISPYSTFLAMLVDQKEAIKNLVLLEEAGLRGEYGFYESIDYTVERLNREETSHIVKSFLAHHQGMTLVALSNILHDKINQKRFHREPIIRAVELLLQEKFPERSPLTSPHQIELSYFELAEEKIAQVKIKEKWSEIINTPHTVLPRTRLLSNGYYNLMVDNAGSGFSFISGNTLLTRWHEDALRNDLGNYVFIKDLDTDKVWSVTYQPSKKQPDFYEVIYNPDKVEFKRRDFDIALHTEITVSPEDNVEVRRITVTNLSRKRRNLQFTSFMEIVLNGAMSDAVHPAYSKMFVESEHIKDLDALVFTRRLRSVDDSPIFLLTMLNMAAVWDKVEYETSRQNFIGRGRDIHHPIMLDKGAQLSGSVGNVLDPIASLRTRVEVEPDSSEILSFITLIGKSREETLFLAECYNDSYSAKRAFEIAWSKSSIEFRTDQISIGQSHLYQHLGNALFFQHEKLRSASELLAQNRLPLSALWRLSISGDLPIVLVLVSESAHLKLVQELLQAHEYLRNRGLQFDLVIVNEYADGYLQNMQMSIEELLRSTCSLQFLEVKAGVYLRNLKQLTSQEYLLLRAVARTVFFGEKGEFSSQLELPGELELRADRRGLLDYLFRDEGILTKRQDLNLSGDLTPSVGASEYENSFGGFIDHGKAYAIKVRSDNLPPAPWINVIANPNFGFTVSETGSGYTWSENSRENRLTPWNNDPVRDRPGEVIYLRDLNTGAFWCPTPLPVHNRGNYRVEHHRGFSTFDLTASRIASKLTISGAISESVKWWHLKLQNVDIRPRQIEIYLYVEWVLGVLREQNMPNLVTSYDAKGGILTAQNFYNNEFAGRVLFLGSNLPLSSYSTSRFEFVGRNHDLSSPVFFENAVTTSSLVTLAEKAQLNRIVELSRKTGAGHDSCGTLKVVVPLDVGAVSEVLFFMGEAPDLTQAREVSKNYRKLRQHKNELQAVRSYWDSISSGLEVKTPDRSFDVMMNSWLIYQTLSARIFGRTGFYQSGGAFGFRDQLQDGLALLTSKPEISRELILLAASRQFIEGDVQHWWHPPTGRGVRTKISDDYLWLPYVVEQYLEVTGDLSILDRQIYFLDAPLLEPTQMDNYLEPKQSARQESLYNHCILALRYGLKFGGHGLPLIGAGDWNDGFNEIGRRGKGESVWLAWFLFDNLVKWTRLATSRNELALANEFQGYAEQLRISTEEHGWDGSWYRRAFFDDGTPLGSAQNEECKIDSIAQSWAVISGGAIKDRSQKAFDSFLKKLIKEEDKLVLLLTPAFDKSNLEPGYIKGYPPGVRENGGQYTHAACWSVIAAAKLGLGNTAHHLFSMINPINHTSDRRSAERYRGEPYVTCGDVYSQAPHVGQAGWSWYTGSSGWLYQAGLNHILGLKIHSSYSAGYFTMEPCIPASWKSYSLRYRHGEVFYLIEVENPSGVESGVLSVELDGVKIEDGKIPFSSGSSAGVHERRVRVVMGESL